MSYRNIMKEEIERVCGNIHIYPKTVRKVYAKALEEAKVTGYSVESMTYEILEGLEEGLQCSSKEAEPYLQHASEIMLDLLHHSAKEDILSRHRQLMFAKKMLDETFEAEKNHIAETFNILRSYSASHGYRKFEKSLVQMEVMMMQHIEELAGEIKYNRSS